MKLKVNWKELGKQLWAGGDDNRPVQANPVTVAPKPK